MTKKPISLDGRVAVITGSTRGIGRAIAERYGQAGAQVVISSSKPDAVEQVVAELSARGIQCIGQACDVSDQAQVQNLLQRTLNEWNRVDIWVNNAGIAGPFGYTLDIPYAVWERVWRVNVQGTYNGCVTALPHMLERRSGQIINLSGGGARRAQRFLTAYSVTKAAIVRMSEGLAREYKDKRFLSINVLIPGMVPTDMMKFGEAVGDAAKILKNLPRVLQIFGTTAEETAEMALFMVSPATNGVSGKVFEVMPRRRMLWRLVQGALRLR